MKQRKDKFIEIYYHFKSPNMTYINNKSINILKHLNI